MINFYWTSIYFCLQAREVIKSIIYCRYFRYFNIKLLIYQLLLLVLTTPTTMLMFSVFKRTEKGLLAYDLDQLKSKCIGTYAPL